MHIEQLTIIDFEQINPEREYNSCLVITDQGKKNYKVLICEGQIGETYNILRYPDDCRGYYTKWQKVNDV